MSPDVDNSFCTEDVQVKPWCALSVKEQTEVEPQLVAFLSDGCVEEQQYVGDSATLVEIGCHDLQADLLSGATGWFVAWYRQAPIGLVKLTNAGSRDPDTGVIAGLYVAPAWRRYGVGRMLVQTVIAEARMCRLRQVFLYVASQSPALRFYQRIGLNDITLTENPAYVRLEYVLQGHASQRSENGTRRVQAKKRAPYIVGAIVMAVGIVGAIFSMLPLQQVAIVVLVLGVGLVSLAISTLNHKM